MRETSDSPPFISGHTHTHTVCVSVSLTHTQSGILIRQLRWSGGGCAGRLSVCLPPTRLSGMLLSPGSKRLEISSHTPDGEQPQLSPRSVLLPRPPDRPAHKGSTIRPQRVKRHKQEIPIRLWKIGFLTNQRTSFAFRRK